MHRPGLLSSLCHSRRRTLQLATRSSNAQLREYATPSSSPSSNPYPYPTHRRPTPHQIFHLPHSATENDIKTRYFDLVRIYHPDKAGDAVSPEAAHERFQAITTAYDILRGKKPYPSAGGSSSGVEDRSYQTTAAYRAARRRRQELYSSGAIDDRWKDRIFLGLAVATVVVFVLQISTSRREVMADIMNTRRPTSTYPTPQSEEGTNRKPSEDEKRLSA